MGMVRSAPHMRCAAHLWPCCSLHTHACRRACAACAARAAMCVALGLPRQLESLSVAAWAGMGSSARPAAYQCWLRRDDERRSLHFELAKQRELLAKKEEER